MTKTRTVILSLDALGKEDAPVYEKAPAIAQVLQEGAHIPAVRSIVPTLTYPAHATLVTGRQPASHGIVNNTKLQPGKAKPDWYWHSRYIKGDTLFKAAGRAKKQTGAIFWPVNAGARIRWNMAEIWPHRRWQNQTMVSLAHSTKRFAIQMARRYGHLLQGIQQPQLDRFAHACALHILQNEDFDLLFVHYTDIDAHKHRCGTRAREVEEAILRADLHVAQVMDALQARGLTESTNLILLSDHSHRDIYRALRLNQIFYRHGLLDASGSNWRAYANSCEGSSYVYLKENNEKERQFLLELLQDIRRTRGGIDRIYSREEVVQKGGDPRCAFWLTAVPGTVFSNAMEGEILGTMDNDYKANHGYPPDLPDYEAMFCAKGPAFTRTTVQRTVPMTDIAPTIARAAGLPLRGADGVCVEEILRV
ncbi:MAG: alkaline phosphatase family protein [Tissierellia bacterium]|jgi:predicted AlkP superfamily pyrophosphatase or phosphodiesterase|nr:ectonucleotide pyrophosphatase/phosphodiesterase [Bacillota bacterium]NLK58042.1 alkaline phosphatase family protein [Tissierellia bacterium]